MILLKNVLGKMAELDVGGNAKPFSIEFVKYDKKRRSGGEIQFYPEAILCFNTEKKIDSSKKNESEHKKPKHSQNETRNIEILNSGKTTGVRRKIHILLIVKFNGELVI